MKESNIQRAGMKALSSAGSRMFRNNVGKCWIGKSTVFRSKATVEVDAGDVVIRDARRFDAGLCKGSSDLIGWHSVEITPEMVGKTVAVFHAEEVKGERGRLSQEQSNFINAVKQAGGMAGMFRSAETAVDTIKQWYQDIKK